MIAIHRDVELFKALIVRLSISEHLLREMLMNATQIVFCMLMPALKPAIFDGLVFNHVLMKYGMLTIEEVFDMLKLDSSLVIWGLIHATKVRLETPVKFGKICLALANTYKYDLSQHDNRLLSDVVKTRTPNVALIEQLLSIRQIREGNMERPMYHSLGFNNLDTLQLMIQATSYDVHKDMYALADQTESHIWNAILEQTTANRTAMN
jgi:hypothetical protein